MSATKSASPTEPEETRPIGLGEEEKLNVRFLQKASSEVTAALFAVKLFQESNTPRAEAVTKASELLSETAEELKKALCSPHPQKKPPSALQRPELVPVAAEGAKKKLPLAQEPLPGSFCWAVLALFLERPV